MTDKIKKILVSEGGAIVVEATLSLSVFMFLIVTILSVINICYAQAKIGTAINMTAKEISQYSYLYELTGLREKQADLYEKSEKAKHTADETLDGITTVFNSAGNIGSSVSDLSVSNLSETFESISGDLSDIDGGLDSIQSSIETVMDDPKDFALSVASLAGNELSEKAKSKLIAAPLSKLLCRKHLVTESCSSGTEEKNNCNAFLKKMGVQPKGDSYIDGLDFDDSVLFLNGTTDIMVIVHYKIKLIKLLDNDITLSFTQCATTRGWVPVKEASNDSDTSEEDSTDTTEATQAKKTEADYLKDYIINPSSADAFIGVTDPSSKSTANYFDGSYMMIDSSDYDDIKENLGSGGVTKVYKAYIDDRLKNNCRIISAVDPDNATDPYFKQQVKYLKQKGYNFEYNEAMGVYVAKKSEEG